MWVWSIMWSHLPFEELVVVLGGERGVLGEEVAGLRRRTGWRWSDPGGRRDGFVLRRCTSP